MKLYCLKHPEKGYLTSKIYSCEWSDKIEKAKKWSYISHVKSMQSQTRKSSIKECEIVQIEIFGYSVLTNQKLEIIEGRSKYENI